jgi:UPF0042 nucleotide-binding protein
MADDDDETTDDDALDDSGDDLGGGKPERQRIVLLTGMSGAGLSTALKAFEDLGYESVDNLRLSLLPALVADAEADETVSLAIALDTRNPNFSADDLLAVLQALKERPEFETKLLFLDCSDDLLQRRFTETRRRHPLATDRPVTDGIQRERTILAKLPDAADQIIDTSLLSLHDLRRLIGGNYRLDSVPGLSLFVTSFSYRNGVPRESDLVFDARFLLNPYWDPKLRPLTGQDPQIVAYVQRDPDYIGFFDRLTAFLLPLLPRYQQEGRSYLTIAIGCTGGRHRSVVVAEHLSNVLASNGYIVGLGHRDLDRSANKA